LLIALVLGVRIIILVILTACFNVFLSYNCTGILGDSVHFGLDELSALSHDVNHPDILLPHKTRDLANLLLTHFLCFRSSSGVHGEPVLRLSKLSNMSLHKQASGGNIEHLGAGESHSGSQEEAGDFTGDS
jgi:hypothetical protein